MSQVSLCLTRPQEKGGEHGHQSKGQKQGTDQREDDRQSHGPKQFTFDAFERQNRQVDNDNDSDGEKDRSQNFPAGFQNNVGDIFSSCPLFVQVPDDIFDHDHCAIDNQAEVDGAQAHEVSRNAPIQHAGESDEHGKRDRRGYDKTAAPIAEQEKKNRNDQDRAFDKIVGNSVNDLLTRSERS